MSLDLIVTTKNLTGNTDAILALFNEEAARNCVGASPHGFEQFATAVAEACEQDGRWPWTAPIAIYDKFVHLEPAHEWWEQVVPEVTTIATDHGLIVYDPQSDSFLSNEAPDPGETYDLLVVHADTGWKPNPNGGRYVDLNELRTIRDTGQGGVSCEPELRSFMTEAQESLPDAWKTADLHSTAIVLRIRQDHWAGTARPLADLAKRHGLVAYDVDAHR